MTTARQKWLIALSYVGSIYVTLEVVPGPLAFLRAHNMLRLSISIVFVACLLVVLKIMHSRTRNVWRYVGLFALAAVYAWSVASVRRPEEKIHFIQYGLVGVLFARALRHHVPRAPIAYGLALLLATAAGWLDEHIQGRLPNRHYDLKDIYLDAAAALLGLLVYALVPHRDVATEKPVA